MALKRNVWWAIHLIFTFQTIIKPIADKISTYIMSSVVAVKNICIIIMKAFYSETTDLKVCFIRYCSKNLKCKLSFCFFLLDIKSFFLGIN